MTHPKDLIVPQKLRAFDVKLREWHIRKKTGGANKHLNKIIAARDAFVHAGLVTAEKVDDYIREYFVKPVKTVAPKQQEMFGE